MTNDEIGIIVHHYLIAALWSETTGEEGTPLYETYEIEDIEETAVSAATEDVKNFIDLCEEQRPGIFDDMDLPQIGHDFLLTRNHHGAGFWDRGLGEVGQFLTKQAQSFGGICFDVTASGKVFSQ